MRKVYLIGLLLFFMGLPVWGGVVVGVDTLDLNSLSGYVVAGSNNLGGSQALAVAWTQTIGITASVGVNFQVGPSDAGGTFHAYLTDAIGGPGSQITSANEVATPITFTLPAPSIGGTFGPAWIDLFDRISFDVGVYYLIVGAGADSSGGWSSTMYPAVTETPGFTRGDLLGGSQFYAFGGVGYALCMAEILEQSART